MPANGSPGINREPALSPAGKVSWRWYKPRPQPEKRNQFSLNAPKPMFALWGCSDKGDDMAKKNPPNNGRGNGPAVAVQCPKPKKKPKANPKLTTARLRKLAMKHKPPQSWFDTEEEGLY